MTQNLITMFYSVLPTRHTRYLTKRTTEDNTKYTVLYVDAKLEICKIANPGQSFILSQHHGEEACGAVRWDQGVTGSNPTAVSMSLCP